MKTSIEWNSNVDLRVFMNDSWWRFEVWQITKLSFIRTQLLFWAVSSIRTTDNHFNFSVFPHLSRSCVLKTTSDRQKKRKSTFIFISLDVLRLKTLLFIHSLCTYTHFCGNNLLLQPRLLLEDTIITTAAEFPKNSQTFIIVDMNRPSNSNVSTSDPV